MSETSFIMTTSGFIMPKSGYYTKVQETNLVEDLIFNRVLTGSDTANMKEYFVDNAIYSSPIANEYLKKYLEKDTFESYMGLVDSSAELLKDIDFKLFFRAQANNPHLGLTSFNLCLSILDGSITNGEKGINYFTIPYGVRFNISQANYNKDSRVGKMVKYLENPYYTNFTSLLRDLIADKTLFVGFYRYMFTDNYSGG